jgi:predicted phosphoribosyltransferase
MIARGGVDRNTVVLGLARGGVVVAAEVARTLELELDVLVVRKLGVPGHEELALGAIAGAGVRVLNHEVIDLLDLEQRQIDSVTARAAQELERCESACRGGREALAVRGRTVVLIDDGLATGCSMLAALAALRAGHPRRIVVAVPVAPAGICQELRRIVQEVLCIHNPDPFHAVGAWYGDFPQLDDQDVRGALSSVAS